MNGRQYSLLIVLALLVASGLRLFRLDHQSFWNDEGNTARLTERPIALIIEGTASDVHPPLYYLILSSWRQLVGATEFGLRLFSAAAGVLLTAVVIAGGRHLFDRPTALAAGLFTALSPPLIYYSQEARMYSLHALWAMLATLLFLKWWPVEIGENSVERRAWPWLAGYLVTAAAGWYTHYSFPMVLVAHSLWAGGTLLVAGGAPFRRWRLALVLVGVMAGVVLLYLPWLPIFLNAAGRSTAVGGLSEFLTRAWNWLLVGQTGRLPAAGQLLMLALIINSAAWRPAGARRWQMKNAFPKPVFLLLLAFVPIGLMSLVGATTDNYLKFLTAAVPALLLLLAAGVVASGRWTSYRWPPGGHLVGGVLLMVALWPSINSLQRLYFDPATFRADYRSLAAQIMVESHPNAGIILNAPNQWEVFTYYYRGEAAVYPFPRFIQPDEMLAAELDAMGARHQRLYAIFWGERGFDPHGVTERWLDEHGFKVIDEFRGDLRFVMVALPGEASLPPPQAVGVTAGDQLQLVEVAWSTTGQPGDVLQVELIWEALKPIDRRYKVFLHLANERGELVSQRDSEPAGNRRPTDTWTVGETVRDAHGVLLPLDLPPGNYTLKVGLYDINHPEQRLPMSGQDTVQDSWSLFEFKLDP